MVNAGDGAREHPTQGLLDLFTAKSHFGELRGLKVAMLGDIAHSRVARSNIVGFSRLGANVVVCGPPTMIPKGIETMGCKVTHRRSEALDGADLVILLRIQKERLSEELFRLTANIDDYLV